MKITNVEPILISVPYDRGGGPVPKADAVPWRNMDTLLVKVETSDGITGWGRRSVSASASAADQGQLVSTISGMSGPMAERAAATSATGDLVQLDAAIAALDRPRRIARDQIGIPIAQQARIGRHAIDLRRPEHPVQRLALCLPGNIPQRDIEFPRARTTPGHCGRSCAAFAPDRPSDRRCRPHRVRPRAAQPSWRAPLRSRRIRRNRTPPPIR